jgi:NlpC/P60 family putative phage cell wall peptidase
VWRAVYGAEPERPGPYAPDWAEVGGNDALITAARRHCIEKPAKEMMPGDLLLFRWRADMPAKHAGILVSAVRFAHAYEGHAVLLSALVPQWRRRIAGVFAFPS